MNSLEINNNTFEDIKHIDEFGNEFWFAREFMIALEYKKWQKFMNVINNAKIACEKSGNLIDDHFIQVGKMIQIAKGAKRKVLDYKLTRYACYLIVQNSDPKKKVVALGQTYFAIQTRKQELNEKEYNELSENEKRFYQRSLTKKGNYSLNQAAKIAGVRNFDKFHNAGYKGLYNGETANDIAKRKGLRYREDILDNMNEDELVANLFRINQTKQRLINDNVQSENEANDVHYEVGKKVRRAIADIGGMMPEEMPTPKKSLKELEKIRKQLDYKGQTEFVSSNKY